MADELGDLIALAQKLKSYLSSDSVDLIRPTLKEFVSATKPVGITRSAHQIWNRARKVDVGDRYDSLKSVIHPPADKTGYGRANLPNIPALYAAWNMPTALDEIRANTGDIVQLIALRPVARVELPCFVVGEYQLLNASGRSLVGSDKLKAVLVEELDKNPSEFYKALFIDCVCTEFYRKVVSKDRPEDYKMTALHAELFLPVGGLIFQSVRNPGAMNIAISGDTFDQQFEVIGTSVVRIKRNAGYGIFELELLYGSCDFENDGKINWESSKARKMSHTLEGGLADHDPFPGWRNQGV